MEQCLPYIGEIQVADGPGRAEPGTGEINYPAMARALVGVGYTRVVGREARAPAEPERAPGRFRKAVAGPPDNS